MKQELPIHKKVYERNSVSNVINRSFTQFKLNEVEDTTIVVPTVEDFFNLYDQLFFDIPKEGENSHQTIITRSSDYLGIKNDNHIDVELLQEEITSLREQLLTANQTIQDIKITGANNK